MVSVANMFIKQMLPQMIVRKLSEEEQAAYAAPYQTIASRKPLGRWPLELPLDGQPADVHEIIVNYNQWLQQTNILKLLIYVEDGIGIGADDLAWCRQNLSNLTAIDAGAGIHFIQEDNPHFIGESLAEWYVEVEKAVGNAVAA